MNDLPFHIDFGELDLYADYAKMSASCSSITTLLHFMISGICNFFK